MILKAIMNYLISFVFIFNHFVSLLAEDVSSMSGFYTDGLDKTRDKIEIVYPEKVAKDGSFVSFYLPHYYNLEAMESRPRRTPGMARESNSDMIHFFVPIDGEKHHLELWPNLDFISPGLVVERRDARDVENINKAKISPISQRQCHYNGQIVGKPNSSAALSTCYGLAGYIRMHTGGEYLIEPVKDSTPAYDKEHPHIMYKRSGNKEERTGSNCITKGSAKEALAERNNWEALFGDEVRKRLSGVNMNELVQEDVRKYMLNANINNASAADNEKNTYADFQKTGKSYDIKTLPEVQNNYQTENLKLMKPQPYDFNYITRSDNSFKVNSNQQHGISEKILNLSPGNKIKQKSAKQEMAMGNIELPYLAAKPVLNKMSNIHNTNWQSGSKIVSSNAIYVAEPEHVRAKRSPNSEENVDSHLESDSNDNDFARTENDSESQDMNNKISSVRNELKSKKIHRESNSKRFDNELGTNEEVPPSNKQKSQSKREVETNRNLINERNMDILKKKGRSYILGIEAQQNCNLKKLVQKRDNKDKSARPTVKNEIENKAVISLSTKYDNLQGVANSIKKEHIPLNDKGSNTIQENNAASKGNLVFDTNKKDIRLDPNEKSWQLNKNAENTSDKVIKILKITNSEELHDIPKQESKLNFEKEDPNKFESDLLKDFRAFQSLKKSKEGILDDKNTVLNLQKSTIKDVDGAKVKKSTNDGVIGLESNPQTYKSPNPRVIINNDNNENIKINELSLENPLNKQYRDSGFKIDISNKQAEIMNSISKSNLENGEHTSDESAINKPRQENFDEIVIRIKTPEGSISDVKHVQQNEEILNGENDVEGKFENIDLALQNNPNVKLINTPLKIMAKDKNKRGVQNKLNNELENDQNNHITVQEGKNNEQENHNNNEFDLIVESQKHEKSITNNKNKRDENVIHLVVEAEPENKMLDSSIKEQKSNLFCQGQNCLEIKPVLLNNTQADASLTNSNSSVIENTKVEHLKTESTKNENFKNEVPKAENNKTESIKNIEKRQAAFEDSCVTQTTTEKPLICFDFYNRVFNIELMITVDFKVVKMHDDDDIENFILTIINMVSSNFYDKSVGININIVLVRLILLTTCIKELDSDRFNPEELLENFCTWQVLINPGKDDHPHHHDLAIFVTRMEKCEGQVMGVAYMTSVCRPDKACIVCVDEGLLLANTITHQIGHSLGADHDDGQSSGCSAISQRGTTYHMAPTISEVSNTWSTCSKDSIIQFVRTQGSWCLTDFPVERSFNFPLILPGQIYSAAQQCKLNYHFTAVPCVVGAFCSRLYCQVNEKLCATKGDPPADGTFCATDMWCFHKQCVHIGRRPGSINGEWSAWTEWSVCTRSCGGGIASSYRICNNPRPENGGRYCIGERIRYKMCSTKPCQGFTESFRDLQCKKTEDKPFKGKIYNWIQYHSQFVNIECSLVCQNRRGDVVMRSPVVADGTPCKAGTRNVCIQGTCRTVGCDFVIDSNAKEDACGVCHGNATECKIIQGVFDEATVTRGLVEFLRIPKHSGMVFVREVAPSTNNIAISGSINRIFYLNGLGNEESMPGDVSFGMGHGVYEKRSGMERIFIRGPTTEELVFYVLFREPNRGIQYQYSIPEKDPTYIPRYLWQYLDWDPCSDPCSGGSQRSHPKCVEDRGGVVDDQYCTESSRPMDIIRPCNDFPCQAKWWVSVWSDCICTGASSIMFRSVLCMRATDESGTRSEIVKESECSTHKKPPTIKSCNETGEGTDYMKRSIPEDSTFRLHRDLRRSVNPKMAYTVSLSPEPGEIESGEEESDLEALDINTKEKEKQNGENNNLKKVSVSLKDNKASKVSVARPKSKLETEHLKIDKNKIASEKEREIMKPALVNKIKGNEKSGLKMNEMLLPMNRGKQTAKLKSGVSSDLVRPDKSKQADDSEPSNGDTGKLNDECVSSTSTTSGSCPTQEPETVETSTCKETNAVQPHKKTTCCKTTPRRRIATGTTETTTLRPVVVKADEINLNDFALTLVPLDSSSKKKMPQSDSEFMNLGNVGQFDIGDEANGTIITGQEALDFLDFARSNASNEPVILHEDMHN